MTLMRNGITRELAAALAVLAFYVLTLLVPLHQASELQRDLARIGFASTAEWSICGQPDNDQSGSTSTLKCPAAGIAKQVLLQVPPADAFAPSLLATLVGYVSASAEHPFAQPDHYGQSRAPPHRV